MKEFSVPQQVLAEPEHGSAVERKGDAEFARFDPGVLVVNVAVIETKSAQRDSKTEQAEDYKGAKRRVHRPDLFEGL